MKRYIILPDLHLPYHDRRAVLAILSYARTQVFDGIVLMGDVLDCKSINPHIAHKPKLKEGLRFKKEIEAAAPTLIALAGLAKERIIIQGNHEAWANKLVERLPELEGLIPTGANLYPGGWDVKPYKRTRLQHRIGKLGFIHGYSSGQTAVRKQLNDLAVSYVCGHLHRFEMVTKPSAHGTILGASLGYLGRDGLEDEYASAPVGWTKGFAELFVRPSGEFNLYFTVITKAGFTAADGKTWRL